MKETILIVDDERVNREYLESVDVSLMMEPAEWKYRYYEQYYFNHERNNPHC